MAQRNEREILRSLHDQNPWWTSNEVPEVLAKPFRRRDFYTLRDTMGEEEIQAVVGPRQVGKTTVMYQLVEHLLEEVDPRRVLYFSFDYPYIGTLTEAHLNDMLDIYSAELQ